MKSLDDLKLTDLIDVSTLQKIQDGFSNVTGMAALTTDADGVAVTNGSNFTDFCMDLTRKSAEGCKRCEKCDKQGAEQTQASGRPVTYYCHAGLYDFAAPIMINGKMVGSFIGGQVLAEKPDETKFRAYASSLGIDSDEYVRALKKVEIVPKHKIDAAADFLATIAEVLSKIAYTNYLSQSHNENLSSANADLLESIHSAESLINQNYGYMKNLSDSFSELEGTTQRSVSTVRSTNETISLIQNVASNMRILGFNAYIEAARAKEYGKSFGVITQEIRDLADVSKASADKIEDAMRMIDTFTKQVEEQVKNTENLIKSSSENIEKLSKILKSLMGNE